MKRELTVQLDVEFVERPQDRERSPRSKCSSDMPGRIPRVARLMALAIRFEGLIIEGVVADQAELARLGHVSRARVTQIMNLLNLAPDIQEALLYLPPVEQGKDPLTERDLRMIVAEPDWHKRRRLWKRLR